MISILVERRDDVWTAHCLDLDIVAHGDDADSALTDLFELISAQVEYVVDNGNEHNLLHSAPRKYWDRYHTHGLIDLERMVFN